MSTPPNSLAVSRSSRCLACRMPGVRLDQLHRDRLQLGLTFEALAQNCRTDGVALSESSLRRHFRRHVAEEVYSQLAQSQEDPPPSPDTPTAFDGLLGKPVNERLVLEAITQAVMEKVRTAEQEWRAATARHPQGAEKALMKFLKMQTALERSLKQLREARGLREDIDKTMLKFAEALGIAVSESSQQFMANHVGMVRDAVNRYLAGNISAGLLVSRLEDFQNDWRQGLADRVSEAVQAKWQSIPELQALLGTT